MRTGMPRRRYYTPWPGPRTKKRRCASRSGPGAPQDARSERPESPSDLTERARRRKFSEPVDFIVCPSIVRILIPGPARGNMKQDSDASLRSRETHDVPPLQRRTHGRLLSGAKPIPGVQRRPLRLPSLRCGAHPSARGPVALGSAPLQHPALGPPPRHRPHAAPRGTSFGRPPTGPPPTTLEVGLPGGAVPGRTSSDPGRDGGIYPRLLTFRFV